MMRVLIVDDEPSYREPLRQALLCSGHEVETAPDLAQALAAGPSFAPDVLVVDFMLRGHTDGLQVVAGLLPFCPRMRTIVITGYPTEGLLARVREIPRAVVLPKPFLLVTLLQLLAAE